MSLSLLHDWSKMVSLTNSKREVPFLNQDDLVEQLLALGIKQGDVLEVHASLKSIGYILGGAPTLLDALLTILGLEGTLVMSAQSWGNSEPAYFENPPIELDQYSRLRETHPAYKGKMEELRYMGELTKALQQRPNSYVSNHPHYAFIAIGKHAKWITQSHPLNEGFSLESPLGKMLELKTNILLIGVNYDRATGMHLGEHLSQKRPIQIQGSRIVVKQEAQWVKFLTQDYNSDDFLDVGKHMEEKGKVTYGYVGKAECKLFSLHDATEYTLRYFKENR